MSAVFQSEKWSVLQTHGLIQVNSTYITARKPAGAVLIRIALLLFMFAAAMLLVAVPLSFLLAPWEAAFAAVGALFIYCGVSFFIRPQMDRERRGWQAGAAGSDSTRLGRLLMLVDYGFAPGRFTAETLLDACVLMGLAGGSEVIESEESPPPSAVTPPDPSHYSSAESEWSREQ